MNILTPLLLSSSILLIACDSFKSENIGIDNTRKKQNTFAKQSSQNIPKYFLNSYQFKQFIDSPDLSYIEKENEIRNYFRIIDNYKINDVALSFADIGANTKWDVDLINQFKHNMQKTIALNPKLLQIISKNLNDKKLKNFAKFYYGNVILNENFPSELYYLKSVNPRAFEIYIKTFYEYYKELSNNMLSEYYLIADMDGNTNIRKEPNSNSTIVGTLNNTEVAALWKLNDWVFIYEKSNIGYVYSKNLKPIKDLKHNLNNTQEDSTKVLLKVKADLDRDGKNEFIVATKPKEQDERNFNVQINIYRSKNDINELWQTNKILLKDPYNGCMLDGLESITAKQGSFNIVYSSCYDGKYAERNVGFKYDSTIENFKIINNTISFYDPQIDSDVAILSCNPITDDFSSYDGRCLIK